VDWLVLVHSLKTKVSSSSDILMDHLEDSESSHISTLVHHESLLTSEVTRNSDDSVSNCAISLLLRKGASVFENHSDYFFSEISLLLAFLFLFLI